MASVLTSLNVNAQTSLDPSLESKAITERIPLDPDIDLWQTATPLQVPLAWQNTTKPMLLGPSISDLTLRSMNNGTWIGFLIEWKDPTRDSTVLHTEDFRDSVAIAMPVLDEPQPPFLGMGESDKPVNILHWRSDWQQDIDSRLQELEDANPNLWVSYYPFADTASLESIPPVANFSQAFVTGWAANNPLSNPFKETPVEDLVAEGFGTLTTQKSQDVIGRGTWDEEGWNVVIARPLATSDPSDAQLQPGGLKKISFAVWEGGANEVDGKKSFSNWHTLSVAGRGAIDGESAAQMVEGADGVFLFWREIVIGVVFLFSIAVLIIAVSPKFYRRAKA